MPDWAIAAAARILRLGYSDRVIAQLVPDILRAVVEVGELRLRPRAALYLANEGQSEATLAGHYNIEWTKIEISMPVCDHVQVVPDMRTASPRILVPVPGENGKSTGVLVLYIGAARECDENRQQVLRYLAQHVDMVVRERRLRDSAETGPLGHIAEAALDQFSEGGNVNGKLLNLLKATIDNFPGGICVLDRNLTVTMTNRRFYELLTLPSHEFPPGCRFEDILRYNAQRGEYGPGDVEKLVASRVRHARLFLEHAFERETGAGLVVESRTAPQPGGGCVLTYVDVTARKKAELELLRHRDTLEETVIARTAEIGRQAQELERMLGQERQINELQRQFVTMASHEFRTPLAIIDGAAQRLARNRANMNPEFLGDKVDQIRSSVSRIVELMESILAAGRLDHGRIEIRHERCDLGELLTACRDRQTAIRRTHRIHLDLARLPPHIEADRSALEQVFTNLISNAVKYAPGAPDIHVSAWQDGDTVLVSVRDEGIGIDAEDLPKMFQRYFRARTSTGIAGTGIGLNLVKQIVELHHGSIDVTSSRGCGSTFTVTLPLRSRQTVSAPSGADAA